MVNIVAILSAAQTVAQSLAQKPGTKGGDLAHQTALAGLMSGAAALAIAAGVPLGSWVPVAAGITGTILWHFLPDKTQAAIANAEQGIISAALAIPTADSSPGAFPQETPQDKGTTSDNNIVVKQP